MSLEYQKLKPKRFPKKSFKHSQESRYWKKYQNVLMEKADEGLLRSDINFCKKDKPFLMATAISARVDLYKLTQPNNEAEAEEEVLKPSSSIFKFKEMVTAINLRQDGNLILCGEKTGRIQLVELQNKFILKTYNEYENQINSFDFKSTMREFVSSSNDTSIKYFSILDTSSAFTIHNAHSDNIKRVQFVENDENLLISGSSDKTVKLWDIRKYDLPLDTVKFSHSIEDFVKIKDNQYVVANGNAMSILNFGDDQRFIKQNEYHAFQKPIMRIKYDMQRQRIIAGGLDNQLKIFSLENSEIKVAYKIKVPSEIYCLDISPDGNHFAIGLNNGSLIVKSKMIEKVEEQDEEEKMLMRALEPSFKSTSKNYKYFYRGQYLTPEIDDLIASQKSRKAKLQPYEALLKQFKYKQSLIVALQTKNPEIVVALLEELIERGALEMALANHNEEEFINLLKFIQWKICDYRYQSLLTEILRVVIDMYSGVIGGVSRQVDKLIADMQVQMEREVHVSSNLKQIQGQVDMMLRMVQVQTQ